MHDDVCIRLCAHEIWEGEGRHEEHWAQACKEVEAGGGAPGAASQGDGGERPPPDDGGADVARIID